VGAALALEAEGERAVEDLGAGSAPQGGPPTASAPAALVGQQQGQQQGALADMDAAAAWFTGGAVAEGGDGGGGTPSTPIPSSLPVRGAGVAWQPGAPASSAGLASAPPCSAAAPLGTGGQRGGQGLGLRGITGNDNGAAGAAKQEYESEGKEAGEGGGEWSVAAKSRGAARRQRRNDARFAARQQVRPPWHVALAPPRIATHTCGAHPTWRAWPVARQN
jgi:hypothetical protein